VITSAASLVERNLTATRVLSCRPTVHCPTHTATVLEGGPVQYRCPAGSGHRFQAADLQQEVPR
jgi:hypothetical protein